MIDLMENKIRFNPIADKQGQGLLESLLALPLLLCAFWALLYLCYWSSLHFFVSYKLEEALLCAVPSRQVSQCRSDLEKTMQQAVLFQEPVRVDIRRSPRQLQGSVSIHLIKNELRIERFIQLPLEKNL